MLYLHIPRLEIQGANFMATCWLVAPPSPMAAAGFAHNLARQIGSREQGVAIIHHDAQLLAEQIGFDVLRPHQMRGACLIDEDDYVRGLALSLQPSVKGHLTLSLVVAFDEETGVAMSRVESFLYKARYAGGVIISAGRPALYSSTEELTRAIRGGFAVHDRSDLVSETIERDRVDPLEAILRLTRKDRMEELPWLMPAVLGYEALTQPQSRRGSRDGHPHVFGEPLVGLVQYRPARDGLQWWRYANVGESRFLVQPYQPS